MTDRERAAELARERPNLFRKACADRAGRAIAGKLLGLTVERVSVLLERPPRFVTERGWSEPGHTCGSVTFAGPVPDPRENRGDDAYRWATAAFAAGRAGLFLLGFVDTSDSEETGIELLYQCPMDTSDYALEILRPNVEAVREFAAILAREGVLTGKALDQALWQSLSAVKSAA